MKTKNPFENKILKKNYALLKINNSIKPSNVNQKIQTTPMNNTQINLPKQNIDNNINSSKIKNNKNLPEKILLTSIYNLSLSRNYNNSLMK